MFRRAGWTRFAAARLTAAAAIMLTLPAVPAAAQDAPPARVDLSGRALDVASGQPVPNVFVGLVGTRRSAFTDERGAFRFGSVPAGRQRLAVEILGYTTDTLTVTVTEGMPAIDLRLRPNPIILEGLEVMNDRLQNRRRSIATSVRTYDATALRASASWDLKDFVRNRTFTSPCPQWYMGDTCIRRRGRVISPAVYINDGRVAGGLDFLMGMPPEEVYLVEIYSGGAQIRVYTNWYAEALASGRTRLPPVITW